MDKTPPPKRETPFVALEVRLKDLPIDKSLESAELYRKTQLRVDVGILQRLLRQEARQREAGPGFEFKWDELAPGERTRLWALAAMADEKDLTEREWELLNRLVPEIVPLEGERAEEFFRGLHGTGIVGQEEAVRAYLERLKKQL